MADNTFDVLAMANAMAAESDDEASLFGGTPETTLPVITNDTEKKPAKKEWVPDATLIDDMPELQNKPAIYDADELKEEEKMLTNVCDDEAMQNKIDTMNDMQRQVENINAFSTRHNIRLHIPEGAWQVKFITAANDTNYTKAQQLLDILLDQIKAEIPDAIEYLTPPDDKPVENNNTPIDDAVNTSVEVDPALAEALNTTQIIIDKRQADQIVWSPDEIDKIKKSRRVELNIVETGDIKFSSIVDADDNAVDNILQQYTRKTNDISSPLPASKYRATFTGLTYPEIIGLQASLEMNSIDAERKKWTIAFNHMKNISIGAWEEYTWYENEKHEIIKTHFGAPVPTAYKRHDVTKFEDFMRKTSFLDRDFILWKILCATTTDTEIVSVTCGVMNHNTHTKCNHVYEWVYDPSSLLDPADVDPTVLEEMSATAEAGTVEECLNIYNNGPVTGRNVVTLPESGWSVVYGHASAWDYIEGGIYSAILNISTKTEDDIRSDDIEDTFLYTVLNCIKFILVPDGKGGYMKISGMKNLVKVLRTLGSVDFQTLGTIMNLMMNGYNYRFSIKNAMCPKCKGKSTIPVEDISQLLFMIARSLENTVVTLKKQ